MTKIICSILFVIASSVVYGQNPDYGIEDLNGAWVDTVQVNGGNGFVFLPDSSWMMIIDGHFVGGKDWKDGRQRISNFFTVDFNSDPMQFDLVMLNKSTKEERKIAAIFEFIETDLIRVAMSVEGNRPKEYHKDDKQTVILRRVNEN